MVKYEVVVKDGESWTSLGVFEMAPGRDMDSKSLYPYGTYDEQAEKFRKSAEREYGRPVELIILN